VKKILTGCLVVAVIAMIGFGVAGYYAYRFARPMIENAGDYLQRAREISQLGDRVANKAPYVPPKNGQLTLAQVDRFLAVQGRVRTELGSRWDEIETKAAEIHKKADSNETLSFAEVTSIFSDIANTYVEARRVQVNALNIHKFSDGEYSWVKTRVYEAAGMNIAGGIDLSAIEDLARSGAQKSTTKLPDMPMPEVPEANIRLVKPHTAKLKEWIPMAVLGL
jgi:hypothetical protein